MRSDIRCDLINDDMWTSIESGVVTRRQQIQARIQSNRMKAQMAQSSQNEYYHQHWPPHQHHIGENEYMYNMQHNNPNHMHGGVIVSQNENIPLTPPMTPMSQQQQQHIAQQQQQQQQHQNYPHNLQNMQNAQQQTTNSNFDVQHQNQPITNVPLPQPQGIQFSIE